MAWTVMARTARTDWVEMKTFGTKEQARAYASQLIADGDCQCALVERNEADPSMVKTPPTVCPKCGYVTDSLGQADGDGVPRPGDVSLCLKCGHLTAFAEDLSLRELTDDERQAVAEDEDIQAIERTRQAVMKRTGH
jgi:hypothetical protein